MNLEIHKPELARRVQAQIRSGHFQDADELIEKARYALDEQTTAAPGTGTGVVVLAASQASPYRDINLTPPRVRLTALMAWLLDTNILPFTTGNRSTSSISAS